LWLIQLAGWYGHPRKHRAHRRAQEFKIAHHPAGAIGGSTKGCGQGARKDAIRNRTHNNDFRLLKVEIQTKNNIFKIIKNI
jgi:hypothetical protein